MSFRPGRDLVKLCFEFLLKLFLVLDLVVFILFIMLFISLAFLLVIIVVKVNLIVLIRREYLLVINFFSFLDIVFEFLRPLGLVYLKRSLTEILPFNVIQVIQVSLVPMVTAAMLGTVFALLILIVIMA